MYTRAQVAAHNKLDDLWMIIYNKVYNMTEFACIHPGGQEMLFECGGLDATLEFEDVGHSSVALAMLQPYHLGQLPPHESKTYPQMSLQPSTIGKVACAKGSKRGKRACRPRDRVLLCLVGAALVSFGTILLLQKAKWVQIST